MKYLLAVAILLTGCSTTVPVKMSFPQAPEELFQACEELEKIPADTVQLSVTSEVVVRNYGKYYKCSTKNQAWQEWYSTQKKIYESVK